MSRRDRKKEGGAKQLVALAIEKLHELKTTPIGLPEDFLVRAHSAYDTKEQLSWPEVRSAASALKPMIAQSAKCFDGQLATGEVWLRSAFFA
jgi:hypothetical protein